MDEKNSQLYGCFLGVLATCFVAVLLFWLVDLALWIEYTIIAVLLLIFGPLGVFITKRTMTGRGGNPSSYPPLPQQSPQTKQTSPSYRPQEQQQPPQAP